MADLNDFGNALRSGNLVSALANPAVANPLGAYFGAARGANEVWTARQAQAQDAWGQALQQATDENGNVDYPKAQAIAARMGPIATMGMMAGLKGASELAGQQQAQGANRNGLIVSAITGAMDAPDDQLPDAVLRNTQRLVNSGAMTQDQANRALLNFSTDPATLRRQLEQARISLLPKEMQQPILYGQPGSQIGPGGETYGTRQDVRRGTVTPAQPSGTGAPLGMTPTELNETVNWTDNRKTLPDGSQNPTYGQTFPITKGELLRLLNPGVAPGGVPNGAVPSSLRNPANKQPAPSGQPANPPASGPQPAPGMTQPSPADAELIRQSGPKFQAEIDTGNQQQPLQTTLSVMQSDIGRFTTGSGANKTLDWKRALQSWAPPLAGPLGIKADQIGAQESFNKAVNLIVAQQAAHASDAHLDVQMGATPHDTLSPEGVDSIIRQLQGNSDYLQARAKLAQAYPNRTDYGGFQAKVADLDPRYFQYQRLNPQQKTAYFNGLPENEREAFKRSYAKTQGIVNGGG